MIRIGTSGWNYPHWHEAFYPRDLPASKWLSYYGARFATVELNKTFYNLPSASQFASWHDESPPGFIFAVKTSRYITHMKKLKDPEQSTKRFFAAVRSLGNKLGPVLFQLPPRWRANPDRLAGLLSILPSDLRYVFELRDPSWMNEEVLALLREAGAAFCIYELAGYRSPTALTADFTYVRLHGPGAAYEGSYDRDTLAAWAGWAREQEHSGHDVYIYFDNDQNGYAPKNASELAALLAE